MTLPDQPTPQKPGRLDAIPALQPVSWVPAPLSSLIGRERELGLVCDLLHRSGARLVTITGPGGVGKTRLARSVAAVIEEEFPDGTWFLPLESVRTVDAFVPAVATAIGVGEVSGRPLLDRVTTRLRDSEALLVLDNFEHIIEAAPALVHLLEACPRLRALVTSRTVLRVWGEIDVAVAPFQVPEALPSANMSDFRRNAAVQLFMARSPQTSPPVPDAEIPVVIEICRRLDGLPLAIELAAARSNVLALQELLARLDHRLPLLAGIARDVPDRHRTMRGAIGWSYELLSGEEQRVFRELSVFAGGWTTDAALGMFDDLEELRIIDIIGSLVDSSLVRRENGPSGPRFRMLETIREFGGDMLESSGKEDAARRRQVHVMLHMGEGLIAQLDRGILTQSLLSFAAAEMPNVLTVLDYCRHTRQHRQALTLAGAVAPFWLFHGFLTEGTAILEDVLAADKDAPGPLRARALRALGMMYRPLRDEARGVLCLEKSLALERKAGDPMSVALTLDFLGVVLLGQGEYDRADAVWDEALALLADEEAGEEWTDHVLQHQGLLRFGKGELEEASRLLTKALSRYRAHGDRRGEASSQVVLALIDEQKGEVRDAGSRIRVALEIWEDLEMAEGLAGCFAATVVLAHAIGRPREAACFYGMAEAVCDASGFRFTLPERATYHDVYITLRAEMSDTAWQRAFLEGRNLPHDEAVFTLRQFLHDIDQAKPKADSALPFGLSPREADVLKLLAAGCRDREIAQELYVSLRTVQTHVSHILGKLEVRSRAEAAAMAVRHDLA